MRSNFTSILLLVLLVTGATCTSMSDKYPALKSRISLMQMMSQLESMMTAKVPLEDIFKVYLEYVT